MNFTITILLFIFVEYQTPILSQDIKFSKIGKEKKKLPNFMKATISSDLKRVQKPEKRTDSIEPKRRQSYRVALPNLHKDGDGQQIPNYMKPTVSSKLKAMAKNGKATGERLEAEVERVAAQVQDISEQSANKMSSSRLTAEEKEEIMERIREAYKPPIWERMKPRRRFIWFLFLRYLYMSGSALRNMPTNMCPHINVDERQIRPFAHKFPKHNPLFWRAKYWHFGEKEIPAEPCGQQPFGKCVQFAKRCTLEYCRRKAELLHRIGDRQQKSTEEGDRDWVRRR